MATLEYQGKTYKVKSDAEKEVSKLMKSLDLTREEAIETYLDDNELLDNPEAVELQKKASSVKISHGAKAETKDRKPRKPKERKVDNEKWELLETVRFALLDRGIEGIEVKTETELSFNYNGNAYTFKLTKHRPKKGEG